MGKKQSQNRFPHADFHSSFKAVSWETLLNAIQFFTGIHPVSLKLAEALILCDHVEIPNNNKTLETWKVKHLSVLIVFMLILP